MPDLFGFTEEEKADEPEVCPQLVPEWYKQLHNLSWSANELANHSYVREAL